VTTASDTSPFPAKLGAPTPRGIPSISRLVRPIGYIAVVLSLTVALGTFFVLMGLTRIAPTQDVVLWAMITNGILVLILILAIGWELGVLLLARQQGRAAARLHIRIVALFSIVAATPAILVAVIASITLDRGLDHWFSVRTQAIINTSLQVAQAYFQEHAQSVGTELLALKPDFERAKSLLEEDPTRFQTFIDQIATFRAIPGIFMIKRDGSIIAQATGSARANFPAAPEGALAQADNNAGMPSVIAPGTTSLVGGVVKLSGYDNAYLYIIRHIDPNVVRSMQMIAENATEYRSLEATRFGVQIAFGLLYLGISLVVLLAAIWLGIGFANRLVSPIRHLIDAANEVAGGNLAVEVPTRRSDGDVGALGTTFNKMTAQLRGQRTALLSANDQIDRRRRFTEAVLSGVTAGVIGVNSEGNVTIANRMALRLLGAGAEDAIGRPVVEVAPEFTAVVAAAVNDNRPEHRDQVVINSGGRDRTINVRVTTESSTADDHGYVITLDDITDLVTAQRSSAWADVARRIAHEIKNPLTPIQLSAERLKRKFGRVITEDREVFDQCTDTIIRQVGDIGRMVDEFSSFARMPKPAFEPGNLADAIRDAVFLVQVSQPDIEFRAELGPQPLLGRFDSRLLGQAIGNLVKNATEGILALPPEQQAAGRIVVKGYLEGENIVVDVIDNGIGLPQENRSRLLEPYVTTREKGTGLGLAIVKKIIEEHGGTLELLDAPEVAQGGHGACIRIILPRLTETAATSDETTPVSSQN
jgi:two-component system nitrogen regulation sensor histidine kinase NtrY